MVPRPNMATMLAVLSLMLALAGCGSNAVSPSARNSSVSPAPSPSEVAVTPATDLSAIACATHDPEDVGELTGAWRGSEGGVYYIRQVGDCVWWFGTELVGFERGVTGLPGFANVAVGRVNGTQIDVEWADLPLGDTLGGGGLTLVYDEEKSQLVVIEQRGDWIPYGATIFTRIEPNASPEASPTESASP